MNTQKSVFNKISQIKKEESVELSQQKVELSIDAEINKAKSVAAEMKKLIDDYQSGYDNAISQINKIKQDLDITKGERPLGEGKRLKKEFEKAGLKNVDVYEDLSLYTEILQDTMRGVYALETKIKTIA
jgi:soluble cytochrome b562